MWSRIHSSASCLDVAWCTMLCKGLYIIKWCTVVRVSVNIVSAVRVPMYCQSSLSTLLYILKHHRAARTCWVFSLATMWQHTAKLCPLAHFFPKVNTLSRHRPLYKGLIKVPMPPHMPRIYHAPPHMPVDISHLSSVHYKATQYAKQFGSHRAWPPTPNPPSGLYRLRPLLHYFTHMNYTPTYSHRIHFIPDPLLLLPHRIINHILEY